MRPEPARNEVARLLWDASYGFVSGQTWDSINGFPRARYLRMASAVRATLLCAGHGRNCEPPSELCCHQCAEAGHVMGDATRGSHADGLRDRTARELGLCDGAPADDAAHWSPGP